jgi:rod shape-determining protein MreB
VSEGVFSSLFGRDMAVDLGTANTLVYVRGRGIVLDEPSVVAVNARDGRPIAVGPRPTGCWEGPAYIHVIRPLREGVIANFDICEKMLAYFIRRVHGRSRFAKPRMVICAPSGVTGVEQRAVQEAAESAGARKPACIIEEPMAAAIGAGVPVHEPTGNMVVGIGGGTTRSRVHLQYCWRRLCGDAASCATCLSEGQIA